MFGLRPDVATLNAAPEAQDGKPRENQKQQNQQTQLTQTSKVSRLCLQIAGTVVPLRGVHHKPHISTYKVRGLWPEPALVYSFGVVIPACFAEHWCRPAGGKSLLQDS